MAFKFFLGLSPEAEVINPSSLTKFRKLRLQNETLLDKLITHTLQIAKENNIQVSKAIIVDSTYTESRYNSKSIRTVLIEKAKELRKSVYSLDESYTTKMPKKKENTGLIEDVTQYCHELLELIKNELALISLKTRFRYFQLHSAPYFLNTTKYLKPDVYQNHRQLSV